MSIKLPRMVLSNKATLKSKVPIWQHRDRKEEDEMICAENQRWRGGKTWTGLQKLKSKKRAVQKSRDQLKMPLDPRHVRQMWPLTRPFSTRLSRTHSQTSDSITAWKIVTCVKDSWYNMKQHKLGAGVLLMKLIARVSLMSLMSSQPRKVLWSISMFWHDAACPCMTHKILQILHYIMLNSN